MTTKREGLLITVCLILITLLATSVTYNFLLFTESELEPSGVVDIPVVHDEEPSFWWVNRVNYTWLSISVPVNKFYTLEGAEVTVTLKGDKAPILCTKFLPTKTLKETFIEYENGTIIKKTVFVYTENNIKLEFAEHQFIANDEIKISFTLGEKSIESDYIKLPNEFIEIYGMINYHTVYLNLLDNKIEVTQ